MSVPLRRRVNREAQCKRSVGKLLAAVRDNRRREPKGPQDAELLDYLESYCGAAWKRGFEAGRRAEGAKV